MLQGKRPIRVKHTKSLSTSLGLTSHERLYFQALVQFDSMSDPEERELTSIWLSDLHPGKSFKTREIDEFQIISHWIHMAIFAMTDLAHAPKTAEDIYALLSEKVPLHEVRLALTRMIDLGLIIRLPTGILKSTLEQITTRDDVANTGVKKYHKGVSLLAQEAIDHQPIETREFQSFSIAIESKKIPLAKEMIRKFRAQLIKALGTESGDQVYQMNLQFFQLTESPTVARQVEDEGVDDLKTNETKGTNYV
jgi:uncharacterized protein (TIGR02147 family)